jgi:hypothetical protein
MFSASDVLLCFPRAEILCLPSRAKAQDRRETATKTVKPAPPSARDGQRCEVADLDGTPLATSRLDMSAWPPSSAYDTDPSGTPQQSPRGQRQHEGQDAQAPDLRRSRFHLAAQENPPCRIAPKAPGHSTMDRAHGRQSMACFRGTPRVMPHVSSLWNGRHGSPGPMRRCGPDRCRPRWCGCRRCRARTSGAACRRCAFGGSSGTRPSRLAR